ncbi:MAG TPA: hypothetical protein VGC04_05825, partial [Cellulomonas sp.]
VPAAAGLTADDLARLAEGLAAVPDALAASGAIVQGSTVEADGGPALAAIADEALAARRHARAALGAALAAGVLGLLAAAATVEVRTRRERERLLARGARRRRLARRDASGVLLAAGLGGGVGWALSAVVGGTGLGTGFGTGLGTGLGTGVAAVTATETATVVAIVGSVAALAACLRRLPVDAARGRSRSALTGALVAVLAVGTGLAVWRLLRAPDEPDAAAQAAPALLLVCCGMLVGLVTTRLRSRPAAGRDGGLPGARLPARLPFHRAWLAPTLGALVGGAALYAVRAGDPTVRTAWTSATVGAALVGAVLLGSDVVARRADTVPPAATSSAVTSSTGRGRAAAGPAGLVAALLVACALGAGAALATADLVVRRVP